MTHWPPHPDGEVIFSRHADERIAERVEGLELDDARGEIIEAILSRRFERRARNIWCVWTRHRERRYSVAVYAHGARIVVLTVLTPMAAVAA